MLPIDSLQTSSENILLGRQSRVDIATTDRRLQRIRRLDSVELRARTQPNYSLDVAAKSTSHERVLFALARFHEVPY